METEQPPGLASRYLTEVESSTYEIHVFFFNLCSFNKTSFFLCLLFNDKPFAIDKYAVSNTQFQKFVRATKYKTEAETFQWSFVLEHLADEEVVKEVDGENGYGRVKDAHHWMAVKGAYWRRPEGYMACIMLVDVRGAHIFQLLLLQI
jgi:hypothetical protein